ncbi:MAG: SPOR domain-containing protein [Crocinitomicaceae bacterium]|nr:SPOR domain-containing protein [Crocinitomicaceae bacterium]
MIKILLIGLICFSGSMIFAQEGNIKVIKDNRINALVAKQSKITPPDVKPHIDGFRVQLYFDSERGNINDARSRFISRFPKIDTYVDYNAPNFFLKVGDFRTRLEAEKVKAAITVEFPTSFIIKEDIFLPRLDKEDSFDN